MPWYLRSGKYLPDTATEVPVELKPAPQRLFADFEPLTGRFVVKSYHRVRFYKRRSWGPKDAGAIIAADGGRHNPSNADL